MKIKKESVHVWYHTYTHFFRCSDNSIKKYDNTFREICILIENTIKKTAILSKKDIKNISDNILYFYSKIIPFKYLETDLVASTAFGYIIIGFEGTTCGVRYINYEISMK